MRLLAGVPVKPFGVAKARLAPRLDGAARRRLGQALALHTAGAVAAAGAEVAIVTGDDHVAGWAAGNGLEVIREPGPGLDAAAGAVTAAAAVSGRPWAVVHADLPIVEAADLAAVFAALPGRRVVLAPARDGGTNVMAGEGPFPFRYGPGSFHRHAAVAAGRAAVVARPGLALDLDTPADLDAALGHPAGAWLAGYVPLSAR